jgi:hypothetical protein
MDAENKKIEEQSNDDALGGGSHTNAPIEEMLPDENNIGALGAPLHSSLVKETDHEDAMPGDTCPLDVQLEKNGPMKEEESDHAEDGVKLDLKNSHKIIDTVVDSFGSSLTMLLAWMTYIMHSATYAGLVLYSEPFARDCPEFDFGCTLANTIYSWYVVERSLYFECRDQNSLLP